MTEVYVWIDFSCINQNMDPAGELKQLDKIVKSCDALLTVVVDHEWNTWDLPSTRNDFFRDYQSKSWKEGKFAYLNRCWTRVEMLYASNVPLCEDIASRQQKFCAGLREAFNANRRQHFLYGTREKMRNSNVLGLEPLRNSFLKDYSPLTGEITKDSDRIKIEELMEKLQPYMILIKPI